MEGARQGQSPLKPPYGSGSGWAHQDECKPTPGEVPAKHVMYWSDGSVASNSRFNWNVPDEASFSSVN